MAPVDRWQSRVSAAGVDWQLVCLSATPALPVSQPAERYDFDPAYLPLGRQTRRRGAYLARLGSVGEGLTGEASAPPSSIDVVCVVVLAAVLRGWA